MNRSSSQVTQRIRGPASRPWPRSALPVIAALLTACSSGATPSASTPPPTLGETAPRAGPEAIVEPDPIEAGRAREGEATGPYAPGVNVLHYDVELALDPDKQEIWGRTGIRLTRAADVDAPVVFDLTGLAVTSVQVDGESSGFRLDGGRLILDPTPTPGPHQIQVAYRGTPDDGLIIGPNVHGAATVFADNWPNRARFWFPSVDHPSDKATVRFIVHAPDRWQVIANGELDSEPTASDPMSLQALGHPGSNAHRTWVWSTGVEIPSYTMVVGAADFHVRSVGLAACGNAPASRRSDGCVDVTYWVFPSDSAQGARIFARADQMVDFFTELIGPFPYEKLANVQSATRFGGMENAAAIFYFERAISSGQLGEGTVSHEIAHQWFGDSVTEALWSHLWLSEGFATYFGALFFEWADGAERFHEIMAGAKSRVLSSPDVRSRPVIDGDDNLFSLLNANNYQKGGWVLHMLRDVLGDEAFYDGIREYYRRYRDGTALTEHFLAVMEEVSGQELSPFFEQWLRHPGFPVIDVDWTWDGTAGEVEIVLEQVQDAAWPTYHLEAAIEVRTPAATSRHRVELADRRVVLRVPSAARPSDVVFDPDGWILAQVR